jgi:hypothetical protein
MFASRGSCARQQCIRTMEHDAPADRALRPAAAIVCDCRAQGFIICASDQSKLHPHLMKFSF